MGIDGIGKPGTGLPPGAAVGADPIAGSAERFEIPAAERAAPASGSEALRELEQGSLSLEQYLEGRVQEAVKHLDGRLAPEQLDFVREALREQLRTDPALVELVRRATGSALPEST